MKTRIKQAGDKVILQQDGQERIFFALGMYVCEALPNGDFIPACEYLTKGGYILVLEDHETLLETIRREYRRSKKACKSPRNALK